MAGGQPDSKGLEYLDVSRRYRRHEGVVDFINFGTINGNHSASLPGNRDESLEITVGRDE